MCIAILKPQGKSLSKELLLNCFTNNPDGCGFAYSTGDDVVVKKFMKFDDFYNEYVKYDSDYTMLIHFRIATHGKIDIENAHPFMLNHRMALVHNGIITGYGDRKTKSDTRDFIDRVIGKISWKMWKNKSFCELVGDAIGGSKLAILDKSGGYVIINESKGNWDDGVWFSNTSYEFQKELFPAINKKYQSLSGIITQYIYKCGDCGKEWYCRGDSWHVECGSCKSDNCYEVGFVINGKETRYSTAYKIGKQYQC